MKKVVRLTENDLIRIVKRVINESSMNSKGGIQSASIKFNSKFGTCFDSKKFPNLYKLTYGSSKTIWGLLMLKAGIMGELFSFGLATVPAVGVGMVGAASTAVGVKNLYEMNASKLDNELTALAKCLGIY